MVCPNTHLKKLIMRIWGNGNSQLLLVDENERTSEKQS